MEEAPDPSNPPDLSERELLDMLEERDRSQLAERKRLGGYVTKGFLAAAACGLIAFASSSNNRDWVASWFREAPPAPPAAASSPAVFSHINPDEEALKQAAGMPTRAAEEAKGSSGTIIDKQDIHFAMQLMQFMQGPAQPQPQPAPEKGADH